MSPNRMPARASSAFPVAVLVVGFRAVVGQVPQSGSQPNIQFERIPGLDSMPMPPELRGQMQGLPPLDPYMPSQSQIQGLPPLDPYMPPQSQMQGMPPYDPYMPPQSQMQGMPPYDPYMPPQSQMQGMPPYDPYMPPQSQMQGMPPYDPYMPPDLRSLMPPYDPSMPPELQGLPLSAFQSVFPGPLVYDQGPASAADIFGIGIPDPIIMEMLGETHRGFQDDVVPMLHAESAAQQAEMDSPHVCHQDVLIHCGNSRSQLQCLGAHTQDISKDCRDIVSKSVPFLCSASIDKFCDTLHDGIMSCLETHVSDVEKDCKNALKVARSLITTANTHKVSVKSTKSGKTASALPSPEDLVKAIRKEWSRITAATSNSEVMRYVWLAVTLSAFVYVMCSIYPELLNSLRLVRQLEIIRAKTHSVLGGPRGSAGEATCLLDSAKPMKPMYDWDL